MDANRRKNRVRWIIFVIVSVVLGGLFWPAAYRRYTVPDQISYTVENGVVSRGAPVTRTYWRPVGFLRWWVPCVIAAYFVIVRWGNVGPKYLVGGEVK